MTEPTKGSKEPVGGMWMPPMMQEILEKMKAGMRDFNPMAMCQAMMASVSKAAEMAAYATPEVRTLFEEWSSSVEREVLKAVQSTSPRDLAGLAADLKLSPEATLYFLGRLVHQGKVTISGIQAAS